MRLKTCVAGLCASVVAVMAFANTPASAESKKKGVVAKQAGRTESITIVDESGRARTRITVTPRSFLDAGTELLPGENKSFDYAVPPAYSPLQEALGPGRNFWRQPLLNPWDFPGSRKY